MKNIFIYVLTSIVLFIALIAMVVIGGEHFDGTGILIGLALMASLILFCLFLFLQNRWLCLWYSIACLLFAVNTFINSHRLFMQLLPGAGQGFALRLEYISMLGFLSFIWLYIYEIFGKGFNRFVLALAVLVPAVYSAIVLFTPQAVFTRILPFVEIAILLSAILIILNMVLLVRKSSGSQAVQYILVLSVTTIHIAFYSVDILSGQTLPIYEGMNLTQIGMILVLFINAVAIILNLNHTETELSTAREREREKDESNKLLERMNRLKTNFIADISHEMKSPLLTMSGYAELTEWEIDAGTVSDDTKKNLRVISEEAHRLALLVERLLDVSIAKDSADNPIRIEIDDILSRAQALLAPLLAPNNNRLDTQSEKNCPPISANSDMVLQVLFNLVGNANRYASHSIVSLTIKQDDEKFVLFTVKDTGTGIKPEILSKVFERGVSGDGSSGLGLPICRGAVEAYGGTIGIESGELKIENGEVVKNAVFVKGTTVTFTLPVYREES